MGRWLLDIWEAISTVAHGMWVTMRYWVKTYEPERGTFTHRFEYPEKAGPGGGAVSRFSSLRFDDLHRLRSVREGLPGRLHLHWQGASDDRQGLQDHGFHDRLFEVHVLCAVRGTLPGGLHLHGRVARFKLL